MTLFRLVLASSNLHKVREFRSLFKSLPQIDLLSLRDFPNYLPPEETGSTLLDNATLKAKDAAQVLGMWSLADDSGLVVPALGGEPGVFSARFAGQGASDLDNRRKLLEKMQHLLDDDRWAYYECALVLASPRGVHKAVSATCEGVILPQEKGGRGFGYDPLFVKQGYNKSFGELEDAVKERISHRRKAFDKLSIALEELIHP
jgi:XTP/dITP diphosphohydrolase